MNYQVVFDVTQQSFPWWAFAVLALLMLVGAVAVVSPQSIRPRNHRAQIVTRFIGAIMLIVVIPTTINSLTNGLKQYGYYHSLLQQPGTYSVLEGAVEDFTPAPYTGSYSDSFTVDGVKFQYSEGDLSPGFNQLSQNGSPINQDGILVRISYVTDAYYPHRNRILRLEIKR